MKTTNTYNITTYPQLKAFIEEHNARYMITGIRLKTSFRFNKDIDAQVLSVELFNKGYSEEEIEKEVRKKWKQDRVKMYKAQKESDRNRRLIECGLPESLTDNKDAMRMADEWLSNRVSCADVVDRILTLEDESAARDETNRELTIEYFYGLDELKQERERFDRNEYTAYI